MRMRDIGLPIFTTIAAFCVALTINTAITMAAPDGPGISGGGDAHEAQAIRFPRKDVLANAIKILQGRIESSNYPAAFRQALADELRNLDQGGKILYIPETVFLGHSRFKGDYTKVMTVGAFTRSIPGDNVYLSRQVIKYDANKLARVIAQELPHHILREDLASDEEVVNTVGDSLMDSKTVPYGELLLRREIVLQNPQQNYLDALRSAGCRLAPEFDGGNLTERNWPTMLGLPPSSRPSQAYAAEDTPQEPLDPHELEANVRCATVAYFWKRFYEARTPYLAYSIQRMSYLEERLEDARSHAVVLSRRQRIQRIVATCGLSLPPPGPGIEARFVTLGRGKNVVESGVSRFQPVQANFTESEPTTTMTPNGKSYLILTEKNWPELPNCADEIACYRQLLQSGSAQQELDDIRETLSIDPLVARLTPPRTSQGKRAFGYKLNGCRSTPEQVENDLIEWSQLP